LSVAGAVVVAALSAGDAAAVFVVTRRGRVEPDWAKQTALKIEKQRSSDDAKRFFSCHTILI
jgi:hypothetical protein